MGETTLRLNFSVILSLYGKLPKILLCSHLPALVPYEKYMGKRCISYMRSYMRECEKTVMQRLMQRSTLHIQHKIALFQFSRRVNGGQSILSRIFKLAFFNPAQFSSYVIVAFFTQFRPDSPIRATKIRVKN